MLNMHLLAQLMREGACHPDVNYQSMSYVAIVCDLSYIQRCLIFFNVRVGQENREKKMLSTFLHNS